MSDPLDTWVEVVALKALERAGWVRHEVERPESVAAHSWGVAWLVLNLLPAHLDRGRALTYAVLHDLAEVRVGDLTPHDGVSSDDKTERERQAMQALTRSLPGGAALLADWEAYEAQADPEARFVRQLDRMDMAVQALAYTRSGTHDLDEFVESARRAIQDPHLVEILDQIQARMESTSRAQ